MNIARYVRTLRYLRWAQISGQVMVRLKRRWRDPAKMLSGSPASWKLAQGSGDLNLCPPVPPQDPESLARGTFCFINQTAELGSPVDWTAEGMPRLWSYNLHYFDWLWSLLDGSREVEGRKADDKAWDSAKKLTLDWIENHRPSKSAGGWEAYPVSLRLMNWALLYGVKYRDQLQKDEAFQKQFLESIGRQVKWLELNIETHIQANHLLENLVALVCVSSVFEGDESERVLARYLPMLSRELDEQFLPDGMHYERSPMYHLRMLWLVKVLKGAWASRPHLLISLTKLAGKMKLALSKLRHPDGEIALFNDAVHGIYHDAWKTDEVPEGTWALEDAGYYGFRDTDGNYLIVDAGAVGPDYQPGHAHADYLSFELSMRGHRMITDTGIGTYDTGERRSYDRSTAAHSTVEVEGANSAEVWGGFRVGRRVTPEVVEWDDARDVFFLKAKHDGYQHLPCQAVHTRSFEWMDGSLEIQDAIQVSQESEAVSRLHFSPECDLKLDGRMLKIKLQGKQYHCLVDGNCEVSIESHPSCLEFGDDKERGVLVMRHQLQVGKNDWTVRIEPERKSENRNVES